MMGKPKYRHSKKPKGITAESDPTDIRIYINGIIHLYLLRERIVSFQSWYVSKTCCKIEIYTKGRDILLEYNSAEKWQTILSLLNEHI